MATSPHQPSRLQDKITALKAELAEKKQARSQILALGQSHAGGGMSTTYPSYKELDDQIKMLEFQIEGFTAQLTGEPVPGGGFVLTQVSSDYA